MATNLRHRALILCKSSNQGKEGGRRGASLPLILFLPLKIQRYPAHVDMLCVTSISRRRKSTAFYVVTRSGVNHAHEIKSAFDLEELKKDGARVGDMLRIVRRYWRPYASISLILWTWALAGCKLTDQHRDREQILRLEHGLAEAWLKHDIAAIEPMIASDLQYWSFSGKRRSKPDMIRAIREADEVATQVSDPIVRIYDRTAIYTARIIDQVKRPDGGVRTSETCVTDVFVKRGSMWQLVANHESLLPDAASELHR